MQAPPVIACASCGDLIPPNAPIYYANIGATFQIPACESCAAFHAGQVFTLGLIGEAQRIIREHAARLSAESAAQR
jgi:hypothetical protein